jgi:hypothetical protein
MLVQTAQKRKTLKNLKFATPFAVIRVEEKQSVKIFCLF